MVKKFLKKSLIEGYFVSDLVIINKQFPIKEMFNKLEMIYLSEYMLKYDAMSNRSLFKLYYLLFEMYICEEVDNNQKQMLRNICREYNYKGIVHNKMGPTLNCAERILIGKLGSFLNANKTSQITKIALVNSLINQYHQYRILDLFKQISTESKILCQKLCKYINSNLLKQANTLYAQNWKDFQRQQFQILYKKLQQIRVMNIRIQHLQSKYMKIQTLQIYTQSEMQQIQERYISKQTKVQIQEIQNNQQNIQCLNKSKQPLTQKSNNTEIKKPIVNVKKNLKMMGAFLKKMDDS